MLYKNVILLTCCDSSFEICWTGYPESVDNFHFDLCVAGLCCFWERITGLTGLFHPSYKDNWSLSSLEAFFEDPSIPGTEKRRGEERCVHIFMLSNVSMSTVGQILILVLLQLLMTLICKVNNVISVYFLMSFVQTNLEHHRNCLSTCKDSRNAQ